MTSSAHVIVLVHVIMFWTGCAFLVGGESWEFVVFFRMLFAFYGSSQMSVEQKGRTTEVLRLGGGGTTPIMRCWLLPPNILPNSGTVPSQGETRSRTNFRCWYPAVFCKTVGCCRDTAGRICLKHFHFFLKCLLHQRLGNCPTMPTLEDVKQLQLCGKKSGLQKKKCLVALCGALLHPQVHLHLFAILISHSITLLSQMSLSSLVINPYCHHKQGVTFSVQLCWVSREWGLVNSIGGGVLPWTDRPLDNWMALQSDM